MNSGSRKLFNIDRALVLCPHTDDEFGCAGTITHLVNNGIEVHYVAFSRCEESVPPGFEKDVLEKECRESARLMGIKAENVQVLDYRVRRFPSHRQEILEDLVKLNRAIKPELVLLPSSHDTHQDHAVIYAEGFRAFKFSSLLGYELPQNTISFENSAFVSLDEELVQRKIEVLSAYKSQANRPYASDEFIRGLAKVRGVQCGASYAEAFEVVRLVL